MCIVAVSNLSDIFIYYIATIYAVGATDESKELLTYLWLSLLKVLLHFAEQAN
jgi:hypothetical protein